MPDSEIKFEVWMPAEGWNGKFAGTGNGGSAGFIFYADMVEPLARGYAVANTDTGHDGGLGDWSFAVGHPEKLVDAGYRAVHEMTDKSKAIIAAHYGTRAQQSYWTGCSAGGWQGLGEANRFPEDYDAIAARAPATDVALQQAVSVLVQQATSDPAGALTRDTLRIVSKAATAACDAADGVRDQVITDPLTCKFDPEVLQCTERNRSNCLTPHQVQWVKRIYRGVVNPRTGEHTYPGPEPTSEPDWIPPAWVSSEITAIGPNYFRDVVFANPRWDMWSFDFDADILRARKQDGGVTLRNPDVSAFTQRGGKLLLWHGWSDGAIPPRNTINYYSSVVATMGADKVRDEVRLFMAPGVNHCGGGEGAFMIDYFSVLERWVEDGKAPDRIIASRPLEGGAVRTRPLCPYPQIARYKGKGNTDDASNFDCVAPKGA